MANTDDGGEGDAALTPEIRAALDAQRTIFKAAIGPRSEEWLSLDLSMGQLKALMALNARAGMTVSEVAETLGVGKPAASMLVDRLAQLGYISRHEDPGDRRRTLVTPTAAGEELVARLRQSGGEQPLARWLRQLAPGDLAALTRGLRALAAICARETEAALPHA